jgi:2',3'-cyclic-nucleotide 2'-phosphodiesterase/3'-nucleotidase
MRIRSTLLAPALALVGHLLAVATVRAEETRLTILHTTDLHGALTAWDYLTDRPSPRGLVKIATLVRGVRREGAPTLLLDAGDCIQGGALETYYQRGRRATPDPMMSAMSRIGYDAMAVGNHEFSFGLPALEQARRAAAFPWLAANIVRTSDRKPAFTPSLIKLAGPVRVGIVGLTTPAVPALEDSANWSGLEFRSPLEAGRAEIARLRTREHCDLIVVLAHTGLERDPVTGIERVGDTPDENWGFRLATELEGADVLILGHTHVVVPSAELGGPLVTQAGKWGELLGRVDVTLARGSAKEPWKVKTRDASMIAVTDSVAQDSALTALAEPYHRAAEQELNREIGQASHDLGAPRGRFEDGPLWELIHQAQLVASGAEVSLAALADPAAVIRRGAITVRDALRAYPYDNTLAVVELTGDELKQALEQSARYLAAYTYETDRPLAERTYPGYNFDTAEGVGYEIDLTRPPGDRIMNLSFRGAPLSADRKLRVAVNGYRLNGGGGFEMIRKAPRVWRTTREVRELLVDEIAKQQILTGSFKRNWTILPDYASTPERPLIDRLVREHVIAAPDLMRIDPDARALRGDLAWWLAHAFGWRESKRSNAFADASDSLEPWLDGLLKRKVLGVEGESDHFTPLGPARPALALDWCERAARARNYALTPVRDGPFRDALMSGIGLAGSGAAEFARADSLTRSQLLGMIANLRFPTVRILETTDFHGAILGGGRERRTNRPVGGAAVLASHLRRLREETPAGAVLVDGGDFFQGTMISNLEFGRPVVEQMNAIGYDAGAIGNHEFDWSADTLWARVREMRFAALGSNMTEKKTGRMPRWVRSDTVVTRLGVRIGILGLCYRNTPTVTISKSVRGLSFEDDSATAARLVPKLREKCDVLIEVGHIPAESDSSRHAVGGDLVRLARGVRGVDAWFGGHSHNLVNDRINGVPVMIAGSHGEYVAVCDLVVDPVAKKVVESRARLVPTYADEVTPDSAIAARVAFWNAGVAPIAAKELGRNARALTRNRGGESTVGDLVADAMRAAARADVALQNSGGLRADLPQGTVTRGAIYEVMPFDNLIFTLDLTGAEIRRALEQSLRFGRVTQVSGIRYGYDASKPEYQRVVTLTDTAGVALDESKVYRVACNDFMATGGDNYDVLSGGLRRTQTDILVRDALEVYVGAQCRDGATLDRSPDGRVQRADRRDEGGE